MSNKKENRGGQREGAGRPHGTTKTTPVSARINSNLAEIMKDKGYTAKEMLEWAIPIVERKR